ncbi:BgtE-5858 [Blumeria graminis f. sp. tritici]|uniref:BgtE-5858 n=2 Tax=Blumeria graminis f. sp. tritici TaxID=62690 RepID=A0A9X9QG91_BLUGR|nr:putative secreted effector protein [Blumeria graminis f. sp. tritici 96224]VDB94462.1 BgtE-5858 [Blumeria graminis f. sp. tritici]
MKGLSPLHLIFTSLLVYKISANIVESDFICEQDIVPKDRINTAIHHACSALSTSPSNTKYPAAFDASTLFLIHDAILFSWPVLMEGESYTRGRTGRFRSLIDSSCKFYGIILTIKNRPDTRCYQPVKAVRLYDLSLSSGPRNPSIFRGYRCQNKVFESFFVDHTFRETHYLYTKWKSNNINILLDGHATVNELFKTRVYLLPSEVSYFQNLYMEKSLNPYYIVINYDFEILGMVSKNLNSWAKCDELYENEPELRQSSDSNKNSIGEFIFPVGSDYKCGLFKFTRHSINSHMQLACNLIAQQDKSPSTNLKSIFGESFILPDVGIFPVRKLILKLPESEANRMAEKRPIRAFVVFDKKCNFHGVFYFQQKNVIKCMKLTQ